MQGEVPEGAISTLTCTSTAEQLLLQTLIDSSDNRLMVGLQIQPSDVNITFNMRVNPTPHRFYLVLRGPLMQCCRRWTQLRETADIPTY